MDSHMISAEEAQELAKQGKHECVGHEVPADEHERPREICCCGAVGPFAEGSSSDEATVPPCLAPRIPTPEADEMAARLTGRW